MATGKNKATSAASLSSEDFASLASAQLDVLGTDIISSIHTADLAGLSTNDIAALGTDHVGVLLTAAIEALGTGDILVLGTDQLQALTTGEITALSTATLTALDASELAALSTSQFMPMDAAPSGTIAVSLASDLTDMRAELDSVAQQVDAIAGAAEVTLGINVLDLPEQTMLEQLVDASRQAQSLGDYTMHAEIEGLIGALHSLKMRLAASTALPAAFVQHLQSLL